MHGASFSALTAISTFIVIDHREIMLDCNSTVCAGLCALAAADTTVGTSFSCNRALIVIRAEHRNAACVLDKLDYLVGARACAHSATNTSLCVNAGNTVYDFDCILRTYLDAITIPKAGKSAIFVSVIAHICNVTALFTAIVELSV